MSLFQQRRAATTYVGLDLPPREHAITPELVRWYIETIGDDHPWYTGPSPFGGPVAPALLLHNPAYANRRTVDWYLPNRYGNLHAKQGWEFFHAVPVGEVVTTRGVVSERYRKRDREFVVAEGWLLDRDGRMMSRSRSTQSFLVEAERTDVVVDRTKEQRSERRFLPADGPVLETLTGRRRVVSEADCDHFVGESRNYHNDVEEARKLGFNEIVVQGTFVTCFISELMTQRFGEGWFLGGRMSLTFVNPLWAGEAVSAGGIVREITPEGTLQRAHLDVWTAKDDGTRTIVGTASALLAE
jgi:acyl dehydratase